MKQQDNTAISLTLIPPAMVSDKVELTIRAAVHNNFDAAKSFEVSVYFDEETPESLIARQRVDVAANSNAGIACNISTKGRAGDRRCILVVDDGQQAVRTDRKVTIVESPVRSIRRIAGTWLGISHWSDIEAKYWNSQIKTMTDDQWRQLVRDMHSVGMDVINIQEVFRNQEYADEHDIPSKGYHGKAFYDSDLFPGRMSVAAKDPIEAILSEADKLDMHVLLGVGMYAWFDYSPESLEWHKLVARELWEKFGSHDSFYGFKIAEEGDGSLGLFDCKDEKVNQRHRENLVNFFAEFTPFCRSLAPDKPVMVAKNAWRIRQGLQTYPAFLENLDILCPFALNRMPEGDLTALEAASILQDLADQTNTHLWLDMEVFDFDSQQALVPRTIEGIVEELELLSNFETVLCYQYPGLMNHPDNPVKLGGADAVKLYRDYAEYISTQRA